jgi:hypothetical protein
LNKEYFRLFILLPAKSKEGTTMLLEGVQLDKFSAKKTVFSMELRQCIKEDLCTFNFKRLFIEHLGWNNLKPSSHILQINDEAYTLLPFTEKCGVVIYFCEPNANGRIPDFLTRRQIDREITKRFAYEHMTIYSDRNQQQQIWQWVRREPGGNTQPYEHHYYKGQDGESLVQKLRYLLISLNEEENITRDAVIERMKRTFNVEHITKRFYNDFRVEHRKFLAYIEGISVPEDQEWYASLILSRLMLVYFIQKKGFLDGDEDYLPNHLEKLRSQVSDNNFFSFYKKFLLRLFHEGLGNSERSSDLEKEFGFIPYLNGGLFEEHKLERRYPDIQIANEAFDGIFTFFNKWQWHLDEREEQDDNQVNPDVLGYIFEKFTNQKEMGAYYTKEDITEYIAKNAIIPCIFHLVQKYYPNLFQDDTSLWQLLQSDPDRYFYEPVKQGIEKSLSEKIVSGLHSISQHDLLNKSAPNEYALPTETWREVVRRRKNYDDVWCKLVDGDVTSIHDLITYNLDIYTFIQDFLEQSQDCELIRHFYTAISQVKVLDPTCGSGAFLLAALNILKPLYEICLTRMEEIVRQGKQSRAFGKKGVRLETIEYFQNMTSQAANHHNRDFFINKLIIMNNLYGVDIKQEVVEICKLRLFLKLVALVDNVEDLEPLPDIDFNVYAGNSLVGFATYDEVKEAVLGGVQKKFDFNHTMERIEDALQKAAQMYRSFQSIQNQAVVASTTKKALKEQLSEQLAVVNKELNLYLAEEHRINGEDNLPEIDNGRPFHWFVAFYEIMAQGGFDVIIGNPPYIEYNKMKQKYILQRFGTGNCGNLYAAVVERSFALCCEEGYIGLIVPLSICGGERFGTLRKTVLRNTTALWLANFEIFPSRLFDGAYQRLSIMLAKHSIDQRSTPPSPHQTYVTRMQRWYAPERPHLMRLITYTVVPDTLKADVFPKLAAPLQASILPKVLRRSRGNNIGQMLSQRKTDCFVYYQEATNYWMKATCRVPFYRKNGVIMAPQHGRFLFFSDVLIAQSIMAMMNSSLFYLWFATYSDGFHLSHALVKEFPVGKELCTMPDLLRLSRDLEDEIKMNAKISTRNTRSQQNKAGDMIEIEEYRMGLSKTLLDQIDTVLARYYDFNDEELEFIINYDIKYRLGKENEKFAE